MNAPKKGLFWRNVPYRRGLGVDPPSVNKIFFFGKAILLYCILLGHPYSLSAESNNIHIKQKWIVYLFLFCPQNTDFGGGVRSQGTCPLKVDLLRPPLSEGRGESVPCKVTGTLLKLPGHSKKKREGNIIYLCFPFSNFYV